MDPVESDREPEILSFMSNVAQQSSAQAKSMGVGVALLLLSLVLALVFPLFAWYGHATYGAYGLASAGVALGVCWLGAAMALLVVRLSRSAPAAGLLGSIFFRMGLPLLVGIWLNSQGGPLAQAGVMGMILVYYLIALVVEVVLSLRVTSAADRNSKAI